MGEIAVLASHVALGWTALSMLTAIAWCVYRAPGRAQRLLVEEAELVRAQGLRGAGLYAHVELFRK